MSTIRSSYCSFSAFCCFQIMWTIFSLPTTHYVALPSWFEYVNLLERPCIFFVIAFLRGTFESFAVVGIKCFLLHFSAMPLNWFPFIATLCSLWMVDESWKKSMVILLFCLSMLYGSTSIAALLCASVLSKVVGSTSFVNLGFEWYLKLFLYLIFNGLRVFDLWIVEMIFSSLSCDFRCISSMIYCIMCWMLQPNTCVHGDGLSSFSVQSIACSIFCLVVIITDVGLFEWWVRVPRSQLLA